MSKVQVLTVDSWEKLLSLPGTVLVDFAADFCPPCELMAPEVESFAAHHPECTVIRVNTDRCPGTAAHFTVRFTPTVLVLMDGKPLASDIGALREEELLHVVHVARERAGKTE